MPTIMNAIEQRQDEDKRLMQARRFAVVVMNMSDNFIAHNLKRDYHDHLIKVAYDNGLEISNGDQRKMYEAMRKSILDYGSQGVVSVKLTDDVGHNLIERGAIIPDNEYVQLYGRVNRPKAETKKE